MVHDGINYDRHKNASLTVVVDAYICKHIKNLLLTRTAVYIGLIIHSIKIQCVMYSGYLLSLYFLISSSFLFTASYLCS